MSKYRWFIFIGIVALVFGGLIIYSRLNSTSIDVSNVNTVGVIGASEDNGNIGDHVFNNTESEIYLVEYGDYQCPGCAAAEPNVQTLLEEYGDDITFIFRNFPLTSIHPNARAAAAAAEAAGLQGQFWEMHDLLFSNQQSWQSASTDLRTTLFAGYANQLELDSAQFEADYAGEAVSQKIDFDLAIGGKDEVSSTPTFLLNGEKLSEDAANGILNGDLSIIKEQLDELLDK